jgi:hypothetical protein
MKKHKPLKKIKSGNNSVWITQPKEIGNILKRRETALNIARGKLNHTGKIETAMQTAEAFGRGLFEELLRKEIQPDWTMKEWITPIAENIFNPLGTGATFTEIKEDQARSLIFRYINNKDELDEPYISTLFNYGFLRGILLSAFPQGELILKNSMAEGAAMDEFTFKANAAENDRIERERIKKIVLENSKMKIKHAYR